MNNSIGKSLFYTEKYSDDSEKEDYIGFSSSFIQKIENIEYRDYFPYNEYSDTKSTLNVEIPLSPYRDIFTNSKSNQEEDKENENTEKIKLENKEIKNNRKIKFRSSKYGIIRRGKIPNKNNKKTHKKTAFDNLQRKIQVSFISFIVNFSNDVLRSAYSAFDKKKPSKLFKDISHEIKKEINYKSCDKFKNSSIKEILQSDISKKYKKDKNNFPINDNIKLIKELYNESESEWFKNYFNMKYLDLFSYYHNKGEPLKIVKINGKNINLSKKTKSFYDLLQKNDDIKNKLIETASIVYFYGYNKLLGKDSFKTEKNNM